MSIANKANIKEIQIPYCIQNFYKRLSAIDKEYFKVQFSISKYNCNKKDFHSNSMIHIELLSIIENYKKLCFDIIDYCKYKVLALNKNRFKSSNFNDMNSKNEVNYNNISYLSNNNTSRLSKSKNIKNSNSNNYSVVTNKPNNLISGKNDYPIVLTFNDFKENINDEIMESYINVSKFNKYLVCRNGSKEKKEDNSNVITTTNNNNKISTLPSEKLTSLENQSNINNFLFTQNTNKSIQSSENNNNLRDSNNNTKTVYDKYRNYKTKSADMNSFNYINKENKTNINVNNDRSSILTFMEQYNDKISQDKNNKDNNSLKNNNLLYNPFTNQTVYFKPNLANLTTNQKIFSNSNNNINTKITESFKSRVSNTSDAYNNYDIEKDKDIKKENDLLLGDERITTGNFIEYSKSNTLNNEYDENEKKDLNTSEKNINNSNADSILDKRNKASDTSYYKKKPKPSYILKSNNSSDINNNIYKNIKDIKDSNNNYFSIYKNSRNSNNTKDYLFKDANDNNSNKSYNVPGTCAKISPIIGIIKKSNNNNFNKSFDYACINSINNINNNKNATTGMKDLMKNLHKKLNRYISSQVKH